MKKKYLTPDLEVILLEEEDIIVTSGGINGDGEGGNQDEGQGKFDQ